MEEEGTDTQLVVLFLALLSVILAGCGATAWVTSSLEHAAKQSKVAETGDQKTRTAMSQGTKASKPSRGLRKRSNKKGDVIVEDPPSLQASRSDDHREEEVAMAREYAKLQTAMVPPPPPKSERFATKGSEAEEGVPEALPCESPVQEGWSRRIIHRKEKKEETNDQTDDAATELCFSESFSVAQELIGLVVGKGGANIKAAEALCRQCAPTARDLTPRLRVDVDGCQVRLFGDTEEVVQRARALLEVVQVRVSLVEPSDHADDDDEEQEEAEAVEANEPTEEEDAEEAPAEESLDEDTPQAVSTPAAETAGREKRREKPEATKWLLVNKGAAIRQLEAATGLARVEVHSGPDPALSLLGHRAAVEAGQAWLAEHRTTTTIPASDDQLRWLLTQKGANIRGLEHASGLLGVDVDRSQGLLRVRGSNNAADLAQRWLTANTQVEARALSPEQVIWLRGEKGSRIQELEQSAKVMCVQVPDKPGFAKESKAEAIAGGEEGPSLGPEEGMLRMMGQQEGLEAAAGWLDTNLPKEGGACQCLEIEVDPALLGFVVGKKGAHLAQVKKLCPGLVEIEAAQNGKVTLLGSPEALAAARPHLEVARESIPLHPIQLQGLLAQAGALVKALEESSGLSRIDLDKEAPSISLTGGAGAILKATLWLEIHMSVKSIPGTESCLTWLMSQQGGPIRDLQAETGVDKVSLEASAKLIVMMGTEEAVKAGVAWMFRHTVERETTLSPRQIHFLVQNKAAQIAALQADTGLGLIDLDRESQTGTLLGTEESVELATAWLEDNASETVVDLNDAQVAWLGAKGPARSPELRELLETSGLSYSHLDYEDKTLRLVGSPAALHKAVAWLAARGDLRILSLPVTKRQLGWIIGKKGANIKELQEETGVQSVQVETEPDRVVLRGSRESLELARLYLEAHLAYLDDIQETDKKVQMMQSELEAMPIIRGQPLPAALARRGSPARARPGSPARARPGAQRTHDAVAVAE